MPGHRYANLELTYPSQQLCKKIVCGGTQSKNWNAVAQTLESKIWNAGAQERKPWKAKFETRERRNANLETQKNVLYKNAKAFQEHLAISGNVIGDHFLQLYVCKQMYINKITCEFQNSLWF